MWEPGKWSTSPASLVGEVQYTVRAMALPLTPALVSNSCGGLLRQVLWERWHDLFGEPAQLFEHDRFWGSHTRASIDALQAGIFVLQRL